MRWWWLAAGAGVLAVLVLGGKTVVTYLRGQAVTLELHPIGGGFFLAAAAAEAFRRMSAAASAAGASLVVNSAWRSNEDQARMVAERPGYAAPVGYSNHEAGRAVDLDLVDDRTGAQRPAAAWLESNAHRFGFRRTVAREPWHWEYTA